MACSVAVWTASRISALRLRPLSRSHFAAVLVAVISIISLSPSLVFPLYLYYSIPQQDSQEGRTMTNCSDQAKHQKNTSVVYLTEKSYWLTLLTIAQGLLTVDPVNY